MPKAKKSAVVAVATKKKVMFSRTRVLDRHPSPLEPASEIQPGSSVSPNLGRLRQGVADAKAGRGTLIKKGTIKEIRQQFFNR